MRTRPTWRLALRALLLGLTVGVGYAAGCRFFFGVLASTEALHSDSATLADLVTSCAAVLAWCCLTWLSAGAVLNCLAAIPALTGTLVARLAILSTPLAFRRVVCTLLGASIALPLGAGTAAAVPAERVARAVVSSSADTLPILDRPAVVDAGQAVDRTSTSSPSARRTPGTGRESIAVRRGDTLWELAAAHLPAGSPPSAIALAWPAWHAANRAAMGPDPDLLVPGQRLRPPATFQRRDPTASTFPSPALTEEPS